MSSKHEEHSKRRRSKSRSRSRERRRSKDRSPEERRKRKRSTAWDDVAVPSLMTAAPGPVPDVSLLGLGLGPMAAAPLAQVYVGNVTFGMSEEEIRFVFERCGAVRHVQLVKDAESHKAYSFVEYESPQAAEQAIATLDGFELAGRKLKVCRPMNPTPTRNAMQASTPALFPMMLSSEDVIAAKHGLPILPTVKWGEPGQPGLPPRYPLKAGPKVYACGLPPLCTLDTVKALFAPYGVIKAGEVGEKDGCRYALLEFASEPAAERAIAKLHGHELLGAKLKVGRALPSPLSPAAMLSALGNAAPPVVVQQDSIEDDNQLLSGGSARMNLMRKLLRGEKEPAVFKQFTAQPAASSGPILSPVPVLPQPLTAVQAGQSLAPTRCVVLKNLVGAPAEVDDDLVKEVEEECSKYGKVEHLLIYDEANPVTKAVEVVIFVLYANLQGAFQATNRLNNRFFAGRRIACSYFDEASFRRLMDT